MGNTKISVTQKLPLKNIPIAKLKKGVKVFPNRSIERMKDAQYITEALLACLCNDDPDSFKKILKTHLDLINKDQFAKEAGISKRTLYRILSPEGNPGLDNISKIFYKLCA